MPDREPDSETRLLAEMTMLLADMAKAPCMLPIRPDSDARCECFTCRARMFLDALRVRMGAL